jgi:uncharacterized membrane protein YgcG
MKNSILIVLLSFFFFANVNAQQEKIYLFKSDIEVLESSDLIITETIKVFANGQDIRSGIFRAIPNTYVSKQGVKFRVQYEILEILRDGSIENYHQKKENGYSYIYLGSENYFLPSGDYTYTIKYKTNKQIGYFDEFDEIYWNVNGNNWNFTTEKIEATITLPKGADIENYTAYTGAYGETNKDYKVIQIADNIVKFESTKMFNPKENMTVAVGWPKGIVYEPDTQEKILEFFKDNMIVFIGLLGTLLAFLVHLANWKKVGVDPDTGTIIPMFKPMKGLSPSAMRYILKMNVDDKAFTAALVSIATKGALTIEKKSKIYHLIKTPAANVTELTKSELCIVNSLFSSGNTFKLTNSKHSQLSSAMRIFNDAEKDLHEETYFKLNRKHLIAGIVLSFLTIASMFILRGSTLNFGSLLQFTPVLFIGFMMFRNIKSFLKNIIGIVFGVMFLFIFFVSSNTSIMTSFEVIVMVIIIFVLIIINLLFAYLMKAPTLFGRKEMDKIEGFKMYLKTAEEERLDSLNVPDKTPQLFEKYLPYAIALDCENQWSKKFENIIQNAIDTGTYTQPIWYIGGSRGFNPGNFTNDIGRRFNNAVNTSSTAPSQRSSGGGGISGGGFSGGGGGGGGGGGW